MIILKFGGTSVGSAQRIKSVASIVTKTPGRKVLVLSAMAGTTDTLVSITQEMHNGKKSEAQDILNKLQNRYLEIVIPELFEENEYARQAKNEIQKIFSGLFSMLSSENYTTNDTKNILACGEKMSTALMCLTLRCYEGIEPIHLDALSFMRIDHEGRPDPRYIKEHITPLTEAHQKRDTLFVTEGYICKNAFGEVDNLRRGGSDYTATLIGESLLAQEIQIWTDIDGLHNNDPRIVNVTSPIRRLSFGEASELARFGAKILHPACIEPAERANIPVKLLYTLDPLAQGTIISCDTTKDVIKAVSAKDGMCVITLNVRRSATSSPSPFEVQLELSKLIYKYHLVVDIITSASDTFVLVVEDDLKIASFCAEAEEWVDVHIQRDMTIVAVVGDMRWNKVGFESQILLAVDDIPIRMITYGCSNYGIDLVISSEDKRRAMIALSDHLFTAMSVQNPELA